MANKKLLNFKELCLTRNCGDFCSELRKMFLVKMKEETLALLAAKTRSSYRIVMAYNLLLNIDYLLPISAAVHITCPKIEQLSKIVLLGITNRSVAGYNNLLTSNKSRKLKL